MGFFDKRQKAKGTTALLTETGTLSLLDRGLVTAFTSVIMGDISLSDADAYYSSRLALFDKAEGIADEADTADTAVSDIDEVDEADEAVSDEDEAEVSSIPDEDEVEASSVPDIDEVDEADEAVSDKVVEDKKVKPVIPDPVAETVDTNKKVKPVIPDPVAEKEEEVTLVEEGIEIEQIESEEDIILLDEEDIVSDEELVSEESTKSVVDEEIKVLDDNEPVVSDDKDEIILDMPEDTNTADTEEVVLDISINDGENINTVDTEEVILDISTDEGEAVEDVEVAESSDEEPFDFDGEKKVDDEPEAESITSVIFKTASDKQEDKDIKSNLTALKDKIVVNVNKNKAVQDTSGNKGTNSLFEGDVDMTTMSELKAKRVEQETENSTDNLDTTVIDKMTNSELKGYLRKLGILGAITKLVEDGDKSDSDEIFEATSSLRKYTNNLSDVQALVVTRFDSVGIDLTKYVTPEYTPVQMRIIGEALLAGKDVTYICNPAFSPAQMVRLLDLQKSFDISAIAKPDIDVNTMKAICKGVALGLDMSDVVENASHLSWVDVEALIELKFNDIDTRAYCNSDITLEVRNRAVAAIKSKITDTVYGVTDNGAELTVELSENTEYTKYVKNILSRNNVKEVSATSMSAVVPIIPLVETGDEE